MMTTITATAMISRLQTAIRNHPWKVLGATVYLGAAGYRQYKAEERLREDAKKKKVLVLPFYKMKIVEEKKSPASALLANLSSNGSDSKVIEIQADELVSLIHEAAQDPSIVSMYGIFGNGGDISTGGWAHLEEIRNALEVFAKTSSSHQQQQQHEDESDTTGTPMGKAMYAYSNTFGGQQSMKEYYLASVFPQIHLQPQGDLNLYGLHATNAFFRDFLKKYGITVHVWKHGAYKNMANVFTHSKYSKEHYENTAGILLPIHKHVCKAIYTSRHEQLRNYGYDFDKFWSMVENAGSLPAEVAHQIGFVDYLPLKNPLDALVKHNKQQQQVNNEEITNTDTSPTNASDAGDDKNSTQALFTKEDNQNKISSIGNDTSLIGDKWKLETDPGSFKADAQISIDDYARQRVKSRQKQTEKWKFFQSLQSASESNIVTKQLLSLVGYSAPYFNIAEEDYSEEKAKGLKLKEKIAVIKINGTIGEATARKAEKALRKVKEQKDIKCVVLRVDSPGGSINACESLYQEIQDIPQNVVVSFGNVSASGGYYISSNAERIFASPSTVTGSIGVVMMRMDFKELAKRYGITFDSIPTSALSGSNDPFYPVNKRMDENFANQADRSYHRFKSLVSDGRNMNMKAVEAVAQGRVWTGEQANRIGLVDELGGLDQAVAFAQQNYTSSGGAEVVKWPPKKSLWEFLMNRGNAEDGTTDIDDLDIPDVFHVAFWGLLKGSNWASFLKTSASVGIGSSNSLFGSDYFSTPSIPVTSGIMLTVDENAAIQCILEDANISQEKLASDGINVL